MPKIAIATLKDPNYVYGMSRLSQCLREEGVNHAFVGGTALQALCCYLNTDKGAKSIKDVRYTEELRPTDDYDIISVSDEKRIKRVLDRFVGTEVVNDHIYETRVVSNGWKNPSVTIESTLQDILELRINFSVAKRDSKILPTELYEEEINTAEEVEFRGNYIQVPIRIVGPDYILASKLARNHLTSGEKNMPKDFYDSSLLIEAMERYNSNVGFEEEKIRPDWQHIQQLMPIEKWSNLPEFLTFLNDRSSRKSEIRDELEKIIEQCP